MIIVDISLTANTHTCDIKDSYSNTGYTYYIMVVYNKLLKQTKTFYIQDLSPNTAHNTFKFYPVHSLALENIYTTHLYLDNWLGYNDYKIYYTSGIADGNFTYTDNDMVDRGFFYLNNSNCTTLSMTGASPNIFVSWEGTYCSGTTLSADTGTTYTTGETSGCSTGFTYCPGDIDDLALWLRPEELSAGTVNVWPDVSGRGRDTTTPFIDPTFSGNVINGNGAVYFSGLSGASSEFFKIDSLGLSDGDDLTIFVVYRPETSTDMTICMFNFDCYGGCVLGASPSDDGSLRFKGHQNVVSQGATTSPGYLTDTWKRSFGIYESGVEMTLIDAVSSDIVGPSVFEGNYNTFYLGVGIPYSDYLYENTYYKGWIAEILLWNRKLTSTELAQMNTYINEKYGI